MCPALAAAGMEQGVFCISMTSVRACYDVYADQDLIAAAVL